MPCESARDLFRHALATLAYRGGNSFRGLPDTFSDFRLAPGSRSAGEILAHIGDLLDWALITVKEKNVWRESSPQEWHRGVERFFTAVTALDDYLASDAPLQAPLDKLLQGPIADALTHVGQIAMMRRIAAAPMKFENYVQANIIVGRISPE